MDPMGITSAHTIVAISEHVCNCPVGAAKSDSVDYNVLIDKWICVKSLGYVLQLSQKKTVSLCTQTKRPFEKGRDQWSSLNWYLLHANCHMFPISSMVYLRTFGWFLGQMLVNIPYMEHMGLMMEIWCLMRCYIHLYTYQLCVLTHSIPPKECQPPSPRQSAVH